MWLGGVSLVLLVVAAANVVNLLFARLAEREGELAVRTALGAGRARIVGQLFIEAMILALLAAATGMVLSDLCSMLLGRLLLPGVDLPPAWADPRLLLFAVAAAVVAGAAAAIVPAIRSTRSDLAMSLKAGRGAGRARSRVTAGLVIFQATLSLLLLVGAGLFLRSAWKIQRLDAGIDMDRLLVASVDYAAADFTPERAALAQGQAMEQIAALPGAAGVTGSNSIPFQTSWAETLVIPGVDSIPAGPGGGPYINFVGPDYFRVVGTPIRRGRGFDARDRAGSARVAVVGESMARIVWGGRSPIGECLRIDTMPCAEIVGIAQDAPRSSLLQTGTMQYYVPADQLRPGAAHQALFVRTERDPADLAAAVRRVLQQASPDLPLVSVQPLWELARGDTRPWQLGATIFSVFGALAMVVAVLGLYSVLAFSVARRRREFGVRAALGASAASVTGLVVRGGLRLVIAGVVLGGLLSLAAARWIAPLLYETRAVDPLVLAGSAALLLVSASIACLVPAIRATRVPPMEALRSE
jgi:predicted permease